MPEPLEIDFVAQHLGDTGAAAVPLALGIAQHWLGDWPLRGWRALIYACSDSGLIGAAIVEAGPSMRSELQRRVAARRGSLSHLPG